MSERSQHLASQRDHFMVTEWNRRLFVWSSDKHEVVQVGVQVFFREICRCYVGDEVCSGALTSLHLLEEESKGHPTC